MRHCKFGFAGSILALSIFTLGFINTVNAGETPIATGGNITPQERLEDLLLEMGYTDVDVSACVMQFRRNLSNQCPTDKSLSYWRRIDLRNLDMETITEVQSRDTGESKWYLFKVRPTRDYYRRSIKILVFDRKIKEKYPSAGWPFHFDELTPIIRKEFYREFPKSEKMNWWFSKTCYGESPFFYVDYRMSHDDQNMLSNFRSALIDYDKSNSCTLEHLSKP